MPTSLEEYAYEFTSDEEDDVEGYDYEYDEIAFGAQDKTSNWQSTTKAGAGVAKIAYTGGATGVGTTSKVANLAQTGNVFSVAQSGASAALAPVATVLGPIGLAMSLVESGFSAYSAHKTYVHIKKLEKVIEAHKSSAREGSLEAIVFCCKKKNSKLKRKGLGCIPVLGSICNSIYSGSRSVYKRAKGTRGVKRREMAKLLWDNSLHGCPAAIAACKEILGHNIYGMIANFQDGHLVLKKKLRSM